MKIEAYFGNDMRKNHQFQGTTSHFSIDKGNSFDKRCGNRLRIVLSQPILITTENDVFTGEQSVRHFYLFEL